MEDMAGSEFKSANKVFMMFSFIYTVYSDSGIGLTIHVLFDIVWNVCRDDLSSSPHV